MKQISANITGSFILNGVDLTNTTVSSSIWSGSFSTRVSNLESFSSSLDATFATDAQLAAVSASLNSYTASNNTVVTNLSAATASLNTFTGSAASRLGSIETTTGSLNTASGSAINRLSSLETASGSAITRLGALETASGSAISRLNSIESTTGSLNIASGSAITRLDALEVASGSAITRLSSLETASGSAITRLSSLETASGSAISRLNSLEVTSGSNITRLTNLENKTGSYATTGSNTFVGGQYFSSSFNPVGFTTTASLYTDGGLRVTKDAYISGTLYLNNVTVFGTQSVAYISSSQLNIGTNIITVNTDTPSVRFGGLAVYDSGSTGLTGSMLWDSQDNQWLYSNPSGSTYDSALFLVGPRNSGAVGSEVGISCNFLSKGNGMHHMTSSGIFEDGSITCFYNSGFITNAGVSCFTTSCAASIVGGTVSGTTGTFSSTATACNFVTNGSTLFGITLKGRPADNFGAIGFYSSDGGTRYGYIQSHSTNCGQLIVNGDGGGQAIFDCRGVVLTSVMSGTRGTFTSCLGVGHSPNGYVLDVCGTQRTIGSLTINEDGGGTKVLTVRSDWAGVDPAINVTTNNCLLLMTNNTVRVCLSNTGIATFACQVCAPQLRLAGSTNIIVNPSFIGSSNLRNGGAIQYTKNFTIFTDDGATGCGFDLQYYNGSNYYPGLRLNNVASGFSNLLLMQDGGNVGIGTTSPSAKLSVVQDITTTAEFGSFGQFTVQGVTNSNKLLSFGFNTATDVGFIQAMVNGTSYNNLLLNARGGNVGIGTISPSSLLHLCTVNTTAAIRIESACDQAGVRLIAGVPGTARASRIDFLNGATCVGRPQWTVINDYNQNGTNDLSFVSCDPTTRVLTVLQSGNVGIGTISPCAKLHIQGTGALQDLLYFCTGGSVNTKFIYSIVSGADDAFVLRRSHTTQGELCIMSWTYQGYVGIGTVTPYTKLDIRGTSASTDSTLQIVGNGVSTLLLGQNSRGGVIRGQGGSDELSFWTGGSGDTGAGSSGTERMRITACGTVKTQTYQALGALDTSGTIANNNCITLNLNGAGGNASIGFIAIGASRTDTTACHAVRLYSQSHTNGFNTYTSIQGTNDGGITITNNANGSETIYNCSGATVNYVVRYINLISINSIFERQ